MAKRRRGSAQREGVDGGGGEDQNSKKIKRKEPNQQKPHNNRKYEIPAPVTAGKGAGALRNNEGRTSKGKGKELLGSDEGGADNKEKEEEEEEEQVVVGKDDRIGNNKRRKKETVEEGMPDQYDAEYEGPVDEHSSDEEEDSEEDDDSSDDSDDEIQLDGALPKRRGANLGANSEDDKNDDDDEEEEGQDREIVDINLDFCDPNERFFHGIRALVGHSYLQDAAGGGAGLSPLVDLAVEQGAVGTVLSTDGEDNDVFGFITALPLRYLAQEHQCAQAVIKYLLSKAAHAGLEAEMAAVIGEGATGKAGLLVNERMINCPMQAVPKLHEALVDDLAWAIENEISEEHKDKFRFDHFVVVAPCESAGGGPPAVSGPAMLSDFYFSRFDDEVLLQEADFFFAMGSAGASAASAGTGSGAGAGGSRGGRRYVVGVVPASKLKECTEAIAQMVA